MDGSGNIRQRVQKGLLSRAPLGGGRGLPHGVGGVWEPAAIVKLPKKEVKSLLIMVHK